MGNLGMIKVLIQGNTILMVLLAITYVAMKIRAIEARNGVAYPNRTGRFEMASGKELNCIFNYIIHSILRVV